MMQILGLSGMYFDAAVLFVTNSSILFRLAMAILCFGSLKQINRFEQDLILMALVATYCLNFKLKVLRIFKMWYAPMLKKLEIILKSQIIGHFFISPIHHSFLSPFIVTGLATISKLSRIIKNKTLPFFMMVLIQLM